MASAVAIELDPRHTEECERAVRYKLQELSAAEFFRLPGQYVLAGIAASSDNVDTVTAVYSRIHFAYAQGSARTILVQPRHRRRYTVAYPYYSEGVAFSILPASTVNPAACLPVKPRVGIKRPRLHSDYDIERRVRPRFALSPASSVSPSDSVSNV